MNGLDWAAVLVVLTIFGGAVAISQEQPSPAMVGCGYLEDGHDLEQMAEIARRRQCLPIDRN